MVRARVFVLREKQAEILPALKPVYEQWLNAEEGDGELVALQKLSSLIYMNWDVLYSPEHLLEFESVELIAASVARNVLDRDPPNTKPPWSDPWPPLY